MALENYYKALEKTQIFIDAILLPSLDGVRP